MGRDGWGDDQRGLSEEMSFELERWEEGRHQETNPEDQFRWRDQQGQMPQSTWCTPGQSEGQCDYSVVKKGSSVGL